MALIAKVQYHELQEVISFVVEKGDIPLFLILDGITDIRNIGGIARTAFCRGVDAIIIPDKGVGALNEDAILTSAGALEKLPVCRVNSLMKAVDELHLNGIKVYASEMTAEKNIAEDFAPIDDHRASAAYRIETATALLTKALTEMAGALTRNTRITGHREDYVDAR